MQQFAIEGTLSPQSVIFHFLVGLIRFSPRRFLDASNAFCTLADFPAECVPRAFIDPPRSEAVLKISRHTPTLSASFRILI